MVNKEYDESQARFLMVGSVVSITLAAFAALAVTTIMPRIAADLGSPSLYPLAFGMALSGQLVGTAVAGSWCDAKGPGKSLITGLVLFLSGLLTCGISPNMEIFVLGRTLQGLGGGFLMVPMYVLVGMLVPPMRRPRYFAAFAASWVIPALAGPALAGALVELISWRAIFITLLPLIILAALVIVPLIRKLKTINNPLPPRAKRTMLAAVGAGVAVSFLQVGLILDVGRLVIGPLVIPIAMLLFIGGGLALLIVSFPVLFPNGTARFARGMPSLVASRGSINAAFVATEAFLPLTLQQGHDWSPATSGLIISVGSITWAIGSWAQSKVTDEAFRAKLPRIGGIAMVIGIGCTAAASFPIVPGWTTALGWAIAGLGCGLSYPALAVLALAATPENKHGWASSSLQLADAMGGAGAFALITAVFGWTATLPAPWPYLPGPLFAVLIAALAAWSGSRIGGNKKLTAGQ